ncbi:perilipin-3-like [Varanus komodoensis]|uniref:perilipin-3-like n=1 Tax=Varanus komodoensis TaxID=61221 RepID=UPI001CF7803D|nr:perilipin-3-like [Varanus komodoensis]
MGQQHLSSMASPIRAVPDSTQVEMEELKVNSDGLEYTPAAMEDPTQALDVPEPPPTLVDIQGVNDVDDSEIPPELVDIQEVGFDESESLPALVDIQELGSDDPGSIPSLLDIPDVSSDVPELLPALLAIQDVGSDEPESLATLMDIQEVGSDKPESTQGEMEEQKVASDEPESTQGDMEEQKVASDEPESTQGDMEEQEVASDEPESTQGDMEEQEVASDPESTPGDKEDLETASDAKDMVTEASDNISELGSVEEDIDSTVTEMDDTTKDEIQEGLEIALAAVSSGISNVSSLEEIVASSMGGVFGKPAKVSRYYLPLTDEELAGLATSVEGFEMEQQKQEQSYFVLLGSLTSKVRQCAFQHSLTKLKHAKENTQDVLSQLHETIVLIEQVKEELDQKLASSGQQQPQDSWLEWESKEAQAASAKELTDQDELETQALEVSHTLAQQLQSVTAALVANLQGLPEDLQEKVQLIRENIEKLQVSFASAESFQDLPSSLLTEGKAQASKTHEMVEELVDHLIHNTPLSWIVGPFIPGRNDDEVIEIE